MGIEELQGRAIDTTLMDKRGGQAIKIKQKIWLEKNGRGIFGQGRRELLRAIEDCTSLNAAPQKLHMPYRAAWGRLHASEDRLDLKLVDHSQGKRMYLTSRAKALLDRLDQLEKQVETLLHKTDGEFLHITKDP